MNKKARNGKGRENHSDFKLMPRGLRAGASSLILKTLLNKPTTKGEQKGGGAGLLEKIGIISKKNTGQ